MLRILFVTGDIYCDLLIVVLLRNGTMRAYVVVILNAPFWLSGVLCYREYKPDCAQQAPLWGGALKAGLQHSREEEDLEAVSFSKPQMQV